jgi:hypothetical protein
MIAVMLLVALAAASLFWPLRHERRAAAAHAEDIDGTRLHIARDAKLRELSDLDLDFRLGKLSAEDFEAVNATVRGEAIEIIRQIDTGAGALESAPIRSRP